LRISESKREREREREREQVNGESQEEGIAPKTVNMAKRREKEEGR
jgi:hypothetical protein